MANPKVVPPTQPAAPKPAGRKPWKPKTPLDVMKDQHGKLQSEVQELEDVLNTKRKELAKFEEAIKVFEGV